MKETRLYRWLKMKMSNIEKTEFNLEKNFILVLKNEAYTNIQTV